MNKLLLILINLQKKVSYALKKEHKFEKIILNHSNTYTSSYSYRYTYFASNTYVHQNLFLIL